MISLAYVTIMLSPMVILTGPIVSNRSMYSIKVSIDAGLGMTTKDNRKMTLIMHVIKASTSSTVDDMA
jgi:hypothetical protein